MDLKALHALPKGGLTKTLRIMKLTAVILLSACLTASANGYSQKVTLSEKNARLEKVFASIKQQTGYEFLYTYEMLQNAGRITIELRSVELQEALNTIFKNQPLTYLIIEKTVVVKPKAAGEINAEITPALPITVRGRIVNENGEPVAGASVKVKGTDIGTSTNDNGEFTLNVPDPSMVLIITSVNIETVEVSVNAKTELATIRVKTSVKALDETIVQAYGTTTQRLNTGNITKIKGEDISKQPVSNPLAALAGRVPGMTIVQSSGIPGSSFKIQIRGRSSLQQGAEPLFIIDGVPFAPNNDNINVLSSLATSGSGIGLSPFNSINPSDIESIEILKDADATAIYGSRGANGVVLISTKKGKAGKTKFDYNIYSGTSRITGFMDMLNTQQYLQMRREAFQNDGLVPNSTTAPDLLVWDTTRYTDFKKLLIGGSAHTTDIQTSVSGGNTNTQFLFGGGFHRETTVLPGDLSDNRGSFKLNLNHQSESKRFNINLSSIYSFDKNNLIGPNSLVQYINLPPNLPSLYDSLGNLKWQQGGIAYENPLAYLDRKYSIQSDNLITNLQLSFKLISGLFIKANLGYNSYLTNEKSLFPKNSQNPSMNPLGSSQFANRARKSWIAEPQIEYVRSNKNHKINILLGSTWQQVTNNGSTIYAGGYTNDALIESLSGAASITTTNDYTQYRYTALFGRINYNFRDKYVLNLSGRRDGSSRFGPDNRFSNFAAAGIPWIFSNEEFFRQKVSWISYGKIRASYGVTGNDQIGDYKYLDAWTTTDYPYQSIPGLFPNALFNPDFGWERTKKFEAAIELGFLKDRILFNSSYFRNRSDNQLINYILPTQTGNQIILRNFPALVQNSGVEFSFTSKNIVSKHFEWVTSANLTIPRNKLIAFPNIERTSYRLLYVVDQPLNLLYNFNYTGVDPATGLYQFEDIDKDGFITSPNDLKINGHLNPKYFGGISNNLQYKSWQLDIFFEFKKQLGQNYLSTFQTTPPGHMFNQSKDVLDRWQSVGNNNTIGVLTTRSFGLPYNAIRNLLMSDGIYSDASFIRLKNIALSYNVSSSVLGKIRAQKCRIYLICQNVLTLTNFKGPDPETQSVYSLPVLKTFAAGLQLTF